jgi:hypothetical protein
MGRLGRMRVWLIAIIAIGSLAGGISAWAMAARMEVATGPARGTFVARHATGPSHTGTAGKKNVKRKGPACTKPPAKKKHKPKKKPVTKKAVRARAATRALSAATGAKPKPKGKTKAKKKPLCHSCPPPCKPHKKCSRPARCRKPPAKPRPPAKPPIGTAPAPAPPAGPVPTPTPTPTPALGPIGAPGPPVKCTSTLSTGSSIEGALAIAPPGSVVCLNAGDYGSVTLSGIAPAGNITLAPTPGAAVTFEELTLTGDPNSNLTIQGFNIPGGVQDVSGTPGGLVFQYNTISHIAQGYGFYFDANGNGGSNTQNGVRILHNQIDHVGECLAVTRGTDQERTFTFAGNVCGPGIGYGDTSSTQPGHYIEIGGVTGIAVDNNAFLGPADPNASTAGLHLNVFHVFGGSSDVDFSSNILWHTQTVGQALLIQEGRFDNVSINNNLDVEDPSCDNGNSNCTSYAFWTADVHGLSFQNNTVVDSYWGVILTISQTSEDYTGGTGYTVAHNVVVGTADNADLSYGDCSSSCVFDYNVTDDPSSKLGGSTHYAAGWAPRWATTSWTPTTPYSRPPSGYYQPAGLAFSAGYQGTTGP